VDELPARDVARATDGELIEAARRAPGHRADELLDVLYRRWYARVAHWCLRICGNRETAADLAQEVFLRVHERLDTFRGDSAFSTWLYAVMRSVAINRGLAAKRRLERPWEDGHEPRAVDPGADAASRVERDDELGRLRETMKRALEPIEARVLYLHYVDGLTLPAITRLLELRNKSGAKAYVVSGKRKLRRGLAVGASRERAVLRST
jgi:RNA polymerase sigma-70 factor (ECF subfamily)